MKRNKYFFFLMLSFIICYVQNCTEENTPRIDSGETGESLDSSGTGRPFYITDRTGMRWDITHAVNEYGMDPDNFRFGLGPNAITPINNPQFITSGDDDFPVASGNFEVIAININGDRRAYPLSVFRKHEVINDRAGGRYIAVTY